ncbi:MAG: hypothetical protein ACRD2W_19595 [Acidimicrobiales bacterium]
MSARRPKGRSGRSRDGGPEPEPAVGLPDWTHHDGQRMFVVDLTPAGLPIGEVDDGALSYVED